MTICETEVQIGNSDLKLLIVLWSAKIVSVRDVTSQIALASPSTAISYFSQGDGITVACHCAVIDSTCPDLHIKDWKVLR
jgi:hypothetical protein